MEHVCAVWLTLDTILYWYAQAQLSIQGSWGLVVSGPEAQLIVYTSVAMDTGCVPRAGSTGGSILYDIYYHVMYVVFVHSVISFQGCECMSVQPCAGNVTRSARRVGPMSQSRSLRFPFVFLAG